MMTSAGPSDVAAARVSEARDRLIAAARRSFATAGFEGAATWQIASEAGVAQSLLRYPFGSKDALWREVIDQLFNGLAERVAAASRRARSGTVREGLKAVIREGQDSGCVRQGDPTLLYDSFIGIAGTAFSLAPEIERLSGDRHAVAPEAIEQLIVALLFIGDEASTPDIHAV